MEPASLARRSYGPGRGPHVSIRCRYHWPEFDTASALLSTMGIRGSRMHGHARGSGMVLAFVQRTTRSSYAAGGSSPVLRVAQPSIILLLRSLSALHTACNQGLFREEQTGQPVSPAFTSARLLPHSQC